MGEGYLPSHVLSELETQAPWDLFAIDVSENISVPAREADVAFIHMDEVYPELADY